MGRPAGWLGAGVGLIALAFAATAGTRWLVRELSDLSAGRLVHGEGGLYETPDSYGAEATVEIRRHPDDNAEAA